MAMAANTARFAEVVRARFAGREFTEDEFRALSAAEGGCTIQTLRRHGVVVVSAPRHQDVRRFTPDEFARFVTDELCGDDLWDYAPEFVWLADEGVFVEREELAPYYMVAEAA